MNASFSEASVIIFALSPVDPSPATLLPGRAFVSGFKASMGGGDSSCNIWFCLRYVPMNCDLSLILSLIVKSSNFINVLYGFLLECLRLCCAPLIFMMRKLVLGCCKTKVQLQHILQTWFGHVKRSFTMRKICSSSGFAMKHVKIELETSAAWSSCPFAGLPPSKQEEVCVPRSVTSCCRVSSWLERKSISCFQ